MDADSIVGGPLPTQGKEALARLATQLRNSLKAWRPKPQLQRRRSRRYENVWLLCWLLKDLGWAMLCGFIAWPAALAAVVLQAQDVLAHWDSAPLAELAHSLATLGWMMGSSIWMTAQLLFEPEVHRSRTSPWYSGSIFAGSADHYRLGVHMMQAVDVLTLLGLATFYFFHISGRPFSSISSIFKWTSSDPTGDLIRQRRASLEGEKASSQELGESQGLVFGMLSPEIYAKVFIVPWILKDLFWCLRSFISAIVCIFLVTVMMADYLWLFKKWKNLALLLWTTGSAVWLSNDLIMHEQENWPMLVCLLSFAVAVCIMCGVIIARPTLDGEAGLKEERDTLL